MDDREEVKQDGEGEGGVNKPSKDVIRQVQDQFALLGQTYAAAVRQCEQGGVLAEGEEHADAKQVQKVIQEALRLIDLLPDQESNDQDEFERLAEEDRKLEEELKVAKAKAERALEKVKRMRRDLAETILKS